MSPEACAVLINEVVPILTAVIPRLRVVGSGDAEEMLQDATASAASMLNSAEERGKPLLGRSTVHYCLQRLKSGRLSTSASRTDVLGPGSQLDGHVIVLPLDAPITLSDNESNLTLGEMLADKSDDPSTIACREIDWQDFLAGEDSRSRDVVFSEAEGRSGMDLAEQWGVSAARVTQKKRQVGSALKAKWGPNILCDVQSRPLWEANLRVCREKAISTVRETVETD